MQDIESAYHEGYIPIPDTVWEVYTTKRKKFVRIGVVFVLGKDVAEAMRAHLSIKGYEPYNLAKKKAKNSFPEANPIIVSQIVTCPRCRRDLDELTIINDEIFCFYCAWNLEKLISRKT